MSNKFAIFYKLFNGETVVDEQLSVRFYEDFLHDICDCVNNRKDGFIMTSYGKAFRVGDIKEFKISKIEGENK